MSEVKQEGEFKLKPKKVKKFTKTPETVKVNLSNTEPVKEEVDDTIKVDLTQPKEVEEDVVVVNAEPQEDPVVEIKEEEVINNEDPVVIQEITEEQVEEKTADLQNEINEAVSQNNPLPENIQKVVDFMNETGGSLEDYVRLNADYSSIDNNSLLREYYKQSKPHLDAEDISLLVEDFEYDEDLDDDKDIRKKKIAYKEEVAKAKSFLDSLKSKYYDEIKLKPGVTQEQQKAVDFFNRYSEEQQLIEQRTNDFQSRTKNYFSEEFKGFDFKLGEKKFRYGLKDNSSVANSQVDINNFVKKFLGANGEVSDLGGYHKALYVANNSDKVINHFYEQGKADAIRELTAKSKNISNEPRPTSNGNVFVNGIKVKAVTGANSTRLKIKNKR